VVRHSDYPKEYKTRDYWISRINMAMFIAQGNLLTTKLHKAIERHTDLTSFQVTGQNTKEQDQLAMNDIDGWNEIRG
jgi:hypothetical protein